MPRERLDQALHRLGLADSREKAKRLILAGEVRVNGHPVTKPGTPVPPDATLEVAQPPRFVSRGGLKLEGALDHFGLDVTGLAALDIGASTGGFTDCLLQRGARRVFAFDVGTNQLVWKLRQDPRVVCREKYNVRHLRATDLDEAPDLLVADVSFISLTLVLPPAIDALKPGGHGVVLIKPQFELAREDIGPGGIVRDPTAHQRATDRIHAFILARPDCTWHGLMDSPITGTDGNREFLAWFQKHPIPSS
ncbi:MAG: TlyA family RNA methyltransferase [Verrucomicrobiales bacterium]|nr:TlyA family RNA methyltransferase [Verrucomicrobiales bacterium]